MTAFSTAITIGYTSHSVGANHFFRSSSADQAVLTQSASAINEIARLAMPAVVSIAAVKTVTPASEAADSLGRPLSPWDLFGGGAGPSDPAHPKRALSLGSGVIINSSGMILTNNHVVDHADRVTVNFDEKHKSQAKVLGTDPKTDLAVLQLESGPTNLPYLQFGDSDKVNVGDWAIAVGSPFGLKSTVSVGVVSAKGRGQMGVLDTEDFIQTDAAINPGSSGGPLLNSHGEIIGLNTAIFSQSGGFIGIGFAIPSKIAKEVSAELINHGRVTRGWMGLAAQDLDADLARYFKVPGQQGALVTQVQTGAPASNASLRPGDVITGFNDAPVDSASQLKSSVAKAKRGTRAALQYIRNGRTQTTVTLIGEQPDPEAASRSGQLAGQVPPEQLKSKKHPEIGLSIRDVMPELAKFLQLSPRTGALVVGVTPGSPAFDAGVSPGDIILSQDQKPVHGAKDVNDSLRHLSLNEVSVLYVQRGPREAGEKIFIPIKSEH